MGSFNPEMMILARERLGLSQSALARSTGITQATISRYEAGLVTPSPEHLAKIGDTLDRPLPYFALQERTYNASSMFHRARKQLTVGEERQIHAQVNEYRIHAAILLREAEVESDFSFHRLAREQGQPEKAAQVLRQLWQLPMGPIRSVVGSIERAGGLVFRCPFETTRIDGVSQWPLDSDHVPPVFFVRDDVPGDRQRFTLSHEIGHVVLHHLPSDDPEGEADRFASEFLMPEREIGPELGRLTLARAAALKCFWRVSMAAIIRRAYDLGKIDERQYRYFFTQMGKLGYRKCEPTPIPAEEPRMLRAILDMHQRSFGRDFSSLSQMMGLREDQFRGVYGHQAIQLRIA